MFSDALNAQFTDDNPRFIAYYRTPTGDVLVKSTNYEYHAWALAETAAKQHNATPVIFDKLGNFGNGAWRVRLRLTPAQLTQYLRR